MPMDVSAETRPAFDRARLAASTLLAVATFAFGFAVWQQSSLNALYEEAGRPIMSFVDDGSGTVPVLVTRDTGETLPPSASRQDSY